MRKVVFWGAISLLTGLLGCGPEKAQQPVGLVSPEGVNRIEIYLESLEAQTVQVMDRNFAFAKGERIHTENSHKYSVAEFQAMARSAGWRPVEAWTDGDALGRPGRSRRSRSPPSGTRRGRSPPRRSRSSP